MHEKQFNQWEGETYLESSSTEEKRGETVSKKLKEGKTKHLD